MSNENIPIPFGKQECIFTPLDLGGKRRDDRRGFGFGDTKTSHGFSAQIEDEDGEEVEILFGNRCLPSDQEIFNLKMESIEEDENRRAQELDVEFCRAIKIQGGWLNRIMSWLGFGG